jgi:hypothetical protein
MELSIRTGNSSFMSETRLQWHTVITSLIGLILMWWQNQGTGWNSRVPWALVGLTEAWEWWRRGCNGIQLSHLWSVWYWCGDKIKVPGGIPVFLGPWSVWQRRENGEMMVCVNLWSVLDGRVGNHTHIFVELASCYRPILHSCQTHH